MSILLGGLAIILLWQGIIYAFLSRNSPTFQPKPYELSASSGMHEQYGEFLYFLYYLNLFPVATTEKDRVFSKEGAESLLRTKPHTITMERMNAIRSGDYGKIWLFMGGAILTGTVKSPTVKPAVALLFVCALCCLFAAFWVQGLTLLGALFVFVMGSNPFQLAEAYQTNNVFSLPITTALLVLAINLGLVLGKIFTLRRALWLAAFTAFVVGTVKQIRTEPALIGLSVILVYLFSQGFTLRKRVVLALFFIVTTASVGALWKVYFEHKFSQAMRIVTQIGGHPFVGPRHYSHGVWHPIFCGLADFDKKYGYQWLDEYAAQYAAPIMKKRFGLTDADLVGFYDADLFYYKRPYEMREYAVVIRDKVLADIVHDPAWYLTILVKRIWRILTFTTPIFPLVPLGSWAIPFSGIFALLVCAYLAKKHLWSSLRLIMFPLPLALPALLIYCDRGTYYYSIFHLVALTVVLYGIVCWMTRRLQKQVSGSERLFRSFPKTRPPLEEKYKAVHLSYYRANRDGASFVTKRSASLEGWMHRRVAADTFDGSACETLEIGAGTLNHLPYERMNGLYDIVEPLHSFYADSPSLSRVRRVFDDIGQVPSKMLYDRIISIATFEHVTDLPRVIAYSTLHLRPNGTLRVAIPSEGSFFWRLAWTLSTGLEFYLKHRLRYSVLMRHEHVNDWKEIHSALRFFFDRVSGTYFGLSPSLSLYQFYDCRLPRSDAARSYLSSIGSL